VPDHVIVGCDWKNPNELVQGLLKQLPKLGLYAYDPDDGSDQYTVIISKEPLTKKQVQEIHED
jgi:hypothetical protein